MSVAGLTGVELDADANVVRAELRIAELADSVLYRDSFLRGETVYVDRRYGGRFEDGPMSARPMGRRGGRVVRHAPGQRLRVDRRRQYQSGGAVDGRAVRSVLQARARLLDYAREGSILDVSGGSVAYRAGFVQTTRLVGADGRIYGLHEAQPDMVFVGFADDGVVVQERWGREERYRSLRVGGSRSFEAAYTEGRAAGAITLLAGQAMVLDGELRGGVVTGERQAREGLAAQRGTLTVGAQGNTNRSWIPHDIVISQDAPTLAEDLSNLEDFYVPPIVESDFAFPLVKTLHLDQDMLNESGFGAYNFHFFRDFEVAEGATFDAGAGAQVLLDANTALDLVNEGNIVIAGTIRAAGGAVNMRGGLNTVTLGGRAPSTCAASGSPACRRARPPSTAGRSRSTRPASSRPRERGWTSRAACRCSRSTYRKRSRSAMPAPSPCGASTRRRSPPSTFRPMPRARAAACCWRPKGPCRSAARRRRGRRRAATR